MKIKLFFMLCLFAMISTGANAYDFESGGIYYRFGGYNGNLNEVSVVDNHEKHYSGDITIPSYVTSNSKEYKVTQIDNNAFYECSNLTSITIPATVRQVGNYGMETVDEGTFYGCSKLSRVVFLDGADDLYLGAMWEETGIGLFGRCNITSVYLGRNLKYYGGEFYGYSPFYGKYYLNSLEIGPYVTSIPNDLFHGCHDLINLKIPQNIISIGAEAFSGCGIKRLSIPKSVTSIGRGAFSMCSSLESISVVYGNPKYYSSGENIIEYTSNTLIAGCKNTIIPNLVKAIGDLAFAGCRFTSVTIPNSVTSIGYEAFYGCSSLISVYVGWKDADKIPSLESSDSFPYSTCDLYVPAGTKTIYKDRNYWQSFRNIIEMEPETIVCTSLSLSPITANLKVGDTETLIATVLPEDATDKSVTWSSDNEGVATVVDGVVTAVAAGTANITATTNDGSNISASCTIIVTADAYSGSCGDNAYWSFDATTGKLTISGSGNMGDFFGFNNVPWYNYRESIKSVEISNQITSIGSYAFGESLDLTSVVIPNSVTKIGECAFSNCSSLTSIEIPNSVTSIAFYAFYKCSGLLSVEIPNSVISIGSYAFGDCLCMTSVVIGNSVTSIGNDAFRGCIVSSFVNNSILNAEEYNYWGALICDKNGLAIENNVVVGCAKWVTSITIPNSVTSIGDGAFYYCSNLNSVVIGNSVTSIGNHAFDACYSLNIIKVESGNPKYDSRNNSNAIIETSSNKLILGCMNTIIPNSVTSIGDGSFSNCSGLANIDIPNSVTSIGSDAFSDCSSLASIEIPNSVTSIGSYAFYDCSGLTSVVIGYSVSSIGERAFQYCSGLKSITVNWGRPLSINDDVFKGIDYDNCILYVPKGTSMMYMSAPVWINFKNIEEFTPDDEDIYTITIRGAQGTIVKQVVELSKSYKFVLDNDKEGNIVSVEFNGKDVTSEVKDGIYTTPMITGNSEIVVMYDNQPVGDTNNDGVVDVADITATASIILNNAKQEQELETDE